MKMCVAYDMLYVTTGLCAWSNMLGMYVSHAAAPFVWLDYVLPYLESHVQPLGT